MLHGASNDSGRAERTPTQATRIGQAPAAGHRAPGTIRDPISPASPEDQPSVRPWLTLRRRGRVIENDEYAAFARRVLAAWSRRVASGDIEAIVELAAAARDVDDAPRDAVADLRGHGYSWAEIAARLGVTRQAQQCWGGSRKPDGNEHASQQARGHFNPSRDPDDRHQHVREEPRELPALFLTLRSL